MDTYFLICASEDHVRKGVAKGFAQAGHGRKNPMNRPAKGDWLLFYSSKDKMEGGEPLQEFTALGRVMDEEPFQPDTKSDFKPYRRKVHFLKTNNAPIKPLLDKLDFIKNKKRWGFYLMSGFRKIEKKDFDLIKKAME
ncbi:MAG TPA: EVE domain-containing protein [Flavitalea sp.]|nr:EVE domain-containing protein [Flavitalea sp.]